MSDEREGQDAEEPQDMTEVEAQAEEQEPEAEAPPEGDAHETPLVDEVLGTGKQAEDHWEPPEEEKWDVPSREKIEEMPTASVADIRRMKDARYKMAQPFPLESIGMKVMIAPCDFRTYNRLMSLLFEQTIEEKGDMTAKSHAALIVSCVVDPQLSDEDVVAFEEAVGTDILRLVGFCRKMSKTDASAMLLMQGVDLAEDFTKATR